MCYSAESSLTAFIIGTAAGSYLLFKSKDRTNKFIGLFLIIVNLMQLLEYFMWIDQKCKKLNEIASKLVNLVLTLQLISLTYGAYIFKISYLPNNILIIISVLLILKLCEQLYQNFFNNNYSWCTRPNEDNSLQWANHNKSKNKIGEIIYYLIFVLTPVFFKDRIKGVLFFLLLAASWLYNRYENWDTSNSRWCYYSAFTPLFFILLEKLQ